MRPIERPALQKTYSTYKSYLRPLLESFGSYCSYCEAAEKMDVEHVVPKSKDPDLEVEWSNLLLGCARCNRDFKKAWNDGREDYLWPDTHDTFHAFEYEETGRVLVSESLGQLHQQAAKHIKDLVKLDDGKTDQPVLNTRRRSVFNMAKMARTFFADNIFGVEEVMLQVYAAPSWSVWMTVFADIPEVKNRLLNDDRFPNTATRYFQDNS